MPGPATGFPADWAEVRQRIIARDDGICQMRGPRCAVAGAEVDHIVPRASGGGHEDDNLRLVCRPCHDDRRRSPLSVPSREWF